MAEAGAPSDPSLQERLALLRGSGAWRADAARFVSLEALARRLEGQPAPVRQRLQDRLQAGLSDFMERVEQRAPMPRKAQRAPAPLAQLNAYIRSLRAASPDGSQELASARAFRQAWEKSRALEQVQQALARRPANAGPLNSHALVLRSLDLLGALSPDYLRRFVAQVETLQWMERAQEQLPRKAAKPAGRRRRKR